MNWATSPSNQPKQDTSSKYSYPISDTCKPWLLVWQYLSHISRIGRGSYISAQCFIEFIKRVGEKKIKWEACRAFCLFLQRVKDIR